MVISKNSWHYRRYKRWEGWKRRTNHSYFARNTLDLCHYMRVVLIFYCWRWPWQRELFGTDARPWMVVPAVALLGGIGGASYGLTQVHNWLEVAIKTGEITGAVLLAALFAFVLIYSFAEKKLDVKIKESETLHLGVAWVKAKKSRVCPILEVDEE